MPPPQVRWRHYPLQRHPHRPLPHACRAASRSLGDQTNAPTYAEQASSQSQARTHHLTHLYRLPSLIAWPTRSDVLVANGFQARRADQRAASRVEHRAHCGHRAKARGDTNASSPSIEDVGSCLATPTEPIQTGPRTTHETSTQAARARDLSTVWESAASPCERWSPKAPQSQPANDQKSPLVCPPS